MFADFVDPYTLQIEACITQNRGLLRPRRLLGKYLTYAVAEGGRIWSVMIKKDTDKYGLQCDCQAFADRESCIHVATVLHSMLIQIRQEEETRENQLALLHEHQNLQQTLRDQQGTVVKDQPAEVFKTGGKAGKGDMNLPYSLPNARDFSIARLTSLMPGLRNVTRRNKQFSRGKQYTDGFEMQWQHHEMTETIRFRVDEKEDILITCTCKACYQHAPCRHAIDVIYALCENGQQQNPFIPYLNLDAEKNALLQEYGITMADDESTDFAFALDYQGKVIISGKPETIASLSDLHSIRKLLVNPLEIRKTYHSREDHLQIGIYFMLTHQQDINAPVRIDAFRIDAGRRGDEKFVKIPVGREESLHQLSGLDDTHYQALMAFSFLSFRNHTGSSLVASYQHFTQQFSDTVRKLYLQYFFTNLDEYWHILSAWGQIKWLPEGENFSKNALQDITLMPEPVFANLHTSAGEKFIQIRVTYTDSEGREVLGARDESEIYYGRLVLCKNRLYLQKRSDLAPFLTTMPKGRLKIPMVQAIPAVRDILYPVNRKYGIEIPHELQMLVRETPLIPAVHLREFEDRYLLIAPKFQYDELVIEMLNYKDHYFDTPNGKQLLIRKEEEEQAFLEYIRSLHPQFRLQTYQNYFSLPFDEVMKNQWFILFSRELMSQDIKLLGFNDLKHFRYNKAKPSWDMKISSGIDWFDVKITVSWDDQVVTFKDIRKAILNGQDFVVLGDGSFGMLPEEWINKYSKLFRFSVDDKEGLKISKKHFNIVELLFDQINDEDIAAEIQEKKQKLLQIGQTKTLPIPTMIQATLRPYQETGYQWMQVLDEISWGGCLADDMGLGKTLQAITFLAYLKDKYDNPTSLIVCPTSLIFNWENEIKKFAPDLKYHLFYGLGRTFSNEHFNDYDVVITSYGIVRNDIETMMQFEWEYVILDESQAIKNPDAISTKAVQLLKARNRLILSGTPMQNNTYDIYSQFNFLNPGLLGGREFFRHEFANPIDKEGDKDTSQMLRKLIKPFMLRRTKAEVATDLPDKTEMVLWCQMDSNQKQVYDEYKDYYRHALMQKIDSEGMAKAGVYILEGLLRLRQICDDPRLVKDPELKPSKGVKIMELVREIKENMGNHKMLVFSQFTEMLALIREELEADSITYCYLDGSTPAAKRKEQVELFQSDSSFHVFLISLKAGGVGLNLTEADYVYIVDPWWNPAVEEQAIDRTHRIGQKNKIFAYRMICKDTVEEKIMQLQEKKLIMTREIVQEDTAFFKSLSREDIGFLFS